jgi:hypothetical protein
MEKDNWLKKIVHLDTRREDVMLPIMTDPRITQAMLFENFPQLQADNFDLGALIVQISIDHGVDVSVANEAYEQAKNKFQRIQDSGY